MPRRLEHVPLKNEEYRALEELKELLLSDSRISRLILFGSTARGERDEESDIDVLVLTRRELRHRERHQAITSVITKINARYGTTISTIVIPEESWNHGIHSVSALRRNVESEGVPL